MYPPPLQNTFKAQNSSHYILNVFIILLAQVNQLSQLCSIHEGVDRNVSTTTLLDRSISVHGVHWLCTVTAPWLIVIGTFGSLLWLLVFKEFQPLLFRL